MTRPLPTLSDSKLPTWQHALFGLLYGSAFSALLLAGGYSSQSDVWPLLRGLAGFLPLLFAGLAGIYREDFWERALFKNKETRRRMLGWLIGIILILVMFRFL